MSATIHYKNYPEGLFKDDKFNVLNFGNKKYFLLCGTCFWMASTLPSLSNISLIRHKECPICVNDVYRFLICDESFC